MAIYQPQQSVLNPHCGQRQTACIRNISAPQRSQRTLSEAGAGCDLAEDAIGTGFCGSDIARIIWRRGTKISTSMSRHRALSGADPWSALRLAGRAAARGAIDFYGSDDMTFAASIAFYSLLSLFPFLLLVFVALGQITMGSQGESLRQVIVRALPAHFDFLIGQLQELEALRLKVSFAGVALTLWASTGVFGAILSAVNYAWGVEKRPNYLKNKLIAFVMLLTAGVLLVGALALGSAAQMAHTSWFVEMIDQAPALGWLQNFVVRNAPTPIFMFVVGLIYYFVPNAKVHVRDVWAGAVLAALAWRAAFAGFTWYLHDFKRFSVDGSIGTVVAFMLWVYVSAAILLYGAHVCAASVRLRAHQRP